MASNTTLIPRNADKIIFAEDLISYVIRSGFPTYTYSKSINSSERLRQLIYTGFNDTVKTAIQFIRKKQIAKYQADLIDIQTIDRINLDYFKEYTNNHRPHSSADEFQAERFLNYCTQVAHMSSYFLAQGIDGAPDIAIDQIVKAFPCDDDSMDYWKILNDAAARYIKLEQDFSEADTPSDSSSSPDYSGSSG